MRISVPRRRLTVSMAALVMAVGLTGQSIAKMNQLEDPEVIEALWEASSAGVSVDLIVRGFCCLRPGVPGRTERIRIRSIIGRFLEHSRIFHFAAPSDIPAEGDLFLGSADWMYRSLSKRIEVVTPVLNETAKAKLWQVPETCLQDRREAWETGADGRYSQLRPDAHGEGPAALGTHAFLMAPSGRRNRADP